jgi:hypothetical protein
MKKIYTPKYIKKTTAVTILQDIIYAYGTKFKEFQEQEGILFTVKEASNALDKLAGKKLTNTYYKKQFKEFNNQEQMNKEYLKKFKHIK